MGKQNLQHQQISNPNYHFGSFRNYKSNPNKNVHICAPPKMGGARLNIYTIPLNQSAGGLERNPSVHSPHRPLGRTPSTSQHRKPSSAAHHHNHYNRSSFRTKPDTNEEEVKVEVYPTSQQTDNQNQTTSAGTGGEHHHRTPSAGTGGEHHHRTPSAGREHHRTPKPDSSPKQSDTESKESSKETKEIQISSDN